MGNLEGQISVIKKLVLLLPEASGRIEGRFYRESGEGIILVVEDDSNLRNVREELLQRTGCLVMAADVV